MTRRIVIITTCLYLFFSYSLLAQNELADFEFFIENELNEELLEVKLESDWKLLRKSKGQEDPEYQPAQMTFYLSETDSVEVNLKIKPRGEFRRKHCLFPPIWLNFDRDDFANSSVNLHDKIKLVTHCKDQDTYKQQMIIEYYIYKMYELFTDYSFRTRMIKINYVDTLNKREPGWNYAFLIEKLDQVAERNLHNLRNRSDHHAQ